MDESYSILRYHPSVSGNIVIGVLYAIESVAFFYYITRHKDKWALCLPLGAIASSIGFFCRTGLDPNDISLMLYIVQSVLIVATPSAFLAFNYMLYGRLITAIDPRFGSNKSQSKMEKSHYSIIPPRIVGRIFIWSDITTFLIQIAAGGLMGGARNNLSLVKAGDTMFLVGVCAQGACYFLFTVLLTVTLRRLVSERQRAGLNRSGRNCMGLDKNTLITASGLYFSSLCIIVRSIYRIIEFAQGHNGYLVSKEVFLIVLDAVPLVLAIGIWAIVWPSVPLDKIAAQVRDEAQTFYMESGNSRLRLPSVNSSVGNYSCLRTIARKNPSPLKTSSRQALQTSPVTKYPKATMKIQAFTSILFSLASFASASHFIAYEGNYYTDRTQNIGDCGCSKINYHGSFKWYGEGQTGRMFDTEGCRGVAQSTLPSNENREGTTGYGWKSIDIIC